MSVYDQYETVIGLEIHVQLATQSKAFCGDDASFGGEPNTHISTISLGHPGTLPRLNKKQVAYAVRLGLALESEINLHSAFDRKNYFYADLPKGYQITQDRSPICIGGQLKIMVDDREKAVRIHHVHMEEDAGKSMHDSDDPYSYIDLNRAGVPLLEIVSEPDLRSAEEVDAYMSAMRQLVQYLGISDGNMQEGSMRCDCNVSVRPKGSDQLGERCEIKNLNSMRYARRAIAFEVKRQIDLIESGGRVSQQTLNFDPVTGETSPLRDKEDAHDYRYFPEPDLPPIILDESYVQKIREDQPALPWELYARLQEEFDLSDYDATLLTAELSTAQYFLQLNAASPHPKAAANLIINKLLPYCQEENIELTEFPVGIAGLGKFIQLIEDGQVSNTIAYQTLLPELIEQPGTEPLELAKKMQLIQNKDEDFLTQLVEEVIAANPEKVKIYRGGKKGLLGFFMGEVMKRSKGQAEPKATNALLREKLEA
ncbi:Asp-tRNA(Asn)/Glu-tRNA(Gln) amidotransferase subunit GatB [Flavilitoribacter nigricans]|uniref:Aspartyl/glutamyl-tRNA(Asn/Gln) amidotransferase subunit B n=1 Tax=Flavilitoribacter nigricans (strain ATCC 23147 / DSM 23189 / NBRC 102662 / NCIMB 1420 / SS-2) TaxID=1122177 RepID=A0A2D0N893_FLAN2|nr:Asp-tRNA(Asn)/Glu-tRNA(Gln) amidotransferase subunit GatB [Flavilitoribacter nigricans]PHN04616.1 Asp-tRNA(Asn)/Glu-tRNA(Gln) amidotransferase GatCAB subunit B [Flavilitoribacter nigricans DSM 23189 = NBRC 102662]